MALELYVFGSLSLARAAGFDQRMTHRTFRTAVAWVVGTDPDRIRGFTLSRVTVTATARDMAYAEGGEVAAEFNLALDLAKAHLREAPMLWMEL